jgi:hypothetical protein
MYRISGALIITSAALVSACNPKDAKVDTTTAAQAGAPTAAPASKASFDPATHVAVIHGKDFSLDAPDSVTAGWTTFHFVNDGPSLHHAALARLDSGKTVADLEAAMKDPAAPPPKWVTFVGGPNAPDPNSESDATFNLPAGSYAVLCFVDMPDHVPHFAKGMIRPLKVVASNAPAAPEPTADATVTLSDYAFTVSGKLTPGKHTIKIVNKGPQDHEIELARIAPGKTSKDLLTWIGKPDGPPPGNALGGIAGAANGTTAYITVDLQPGNYAFICFLPDAKDHKTHAEHGMVRDFKVE